MNLTKLKEMRLSKNVVNKKIEENKEIINNNFEQILNKALTEQLERIILLKNNETNLNNLKKNDNESLKEEKPVVNKTIQETPSNSETVLKKNDELLKDAGSVFDDSFFISMSKVLVVILIVLSSLAIIYLLVMLIIIPIVKFKKLKT